MPNEPPSPSLTSLLFSTSGQLFKAATQSAFLVAAGDGTLTKAKLSEWLGQDRLYAQAYIGFVGSLLAHAQLPTQHIPFPHHDDSVHWRIVHTLRASLDNIFRELKFFEDVAENYGLDLEATSTDTPFGPAIATTNYINLFERFSSPINPDDPRGTDWVLLNGLIVLWATEKCYLEAWQFAARQSDISRAPPSDADGGALRDHFIPNWTSQEFAAFVQQLEQLVNDLLDKETLFLTKDAQDECEELWEEVLDIESRFWPEL